MQARIDVESEPGQGSTFTLMLPVEACAEQPRRELPDVAGIHCLVFESDAFASDDVCAYLSHAGARVQRVTDVRAAAALAATLPAPVVAIRHAGAHPARVAPWRDAPHVRQLLITRGQRRRARVEATGAVTLDGAALRRQALLGAVAVAAGRASPPPVPAPHVTVAARAPSIEQARDRGDLILVAEDDPVNQLVIRQQLEVLGHAAEIAADGEEALARWRAGRYALLLTDLHMPRMDGWSLARAIRQEEQERGGAPRLPIVALTANALREEAERARAAGIDGYLTKPASLEQLRLTLAQWLRPRTAAAAWDVEVLRALAGDDGATLRELLTTFLAVLSEQAPALRAAAEGGDLRSAAAIAHKLKSSARSVGAFALGDLCAELETALKSGVRIGAEPLARLAAAVARVEAEIGAFLAAPRRT
jgi:CheY-like chemotaxis protein/HPt (histidine-containing phosphotransfer) domain-containing protein